MRLYQTHTAQKRPSEVLDGVFLIFLSFLLHLRGQIPFLLRNCNDRFSTEFNGDPVLLGGAWQCGLVVDVLLKEMITMLLQAYTNKTRYDATEG